MNPLLPAEKLIRFNEVVNSQNDNKTFADKIYSRVKDAESILIKDPTGLTFHYFPKFEGETDEQAYARRPVAIPKAFVEKYDEETVEDGAEGETPDLDSVEHLKAQVKAWIDESILGANVEYGADDIIRIVSSHGSPEFPKFVYEIAKNGRFDATIPFSQKRFSSTREDISKTAIELGLTEIVVTSLNLDEVRQQLAAMFTAPVDDTPEVPENPSEPENKKVLFPSDIVLPMTHLKNSQVYIAEISVHSFDYYGQFFFKVEKEETAPVNPDLTIVPTTGEEATTPGINCTIALTGGPTQLIGRLHYRLSGTTDAFLSQDFTIENGGSVNVPVTEGDSYETYVWLTIDGVEQTSARTVIDRTGDVVTPVVSKLKFSATNTWSDPDERYHNYLNPGDSIFLLFNVTNITEPLEAKLLEVAPEGETKSGLFNSIEGVITINPGVNIIPFTAPTGLPSSLSNRLLALVNKETIVFGDTNQTNLFATSNGMNLNVPAKTMPLQIITTDPDETIDLEVVKTEGITATWSNVSGIEYSTKILQWSATGGGGTQIQKVDTRDHTIVKVLAPYAIAGNAITIKLETDAGEVTKVVNVVAER